MSKPQIAYWEVAKNHLSKRDKVLKKIIASYHGETMALRGDAFYTLARSIIGQQISVKAADTVWRRFENLLVEITPQKAIAASEINLRECGLSLQKIRYIHALSQHFCEQKNSVENWQNLPDAELIKELTKLNGIGKWTAEMFMIFHLARPDILPLADIGLQKAIFRHYNNAQKMPLSEIAKIAENWKPYQTVATWYLWRSLDPVPVAY
jgi:DNA-3-methyladenine glycosylase II